MTTVRGSRARPAHPGGLPGGLLTFVFTDIEGSTRLCQLLGAGFPAVMSAYEAQLHQHFTSHGGAVVATMGDGLFAVFTSAASAVQACFAAQRSLAEHSWPAGTQVRVRMGVHSAVAEPVGATYSSIAVHQAARIAAAGHGGQVLVSTSTARLVASKGLCGNLRLDSLGWHRLRDFPESEQIYQLSHPLLTDRFPPLRTAAVVPGNLPYHRASFVGRARDSNQVVRLLNQAGFVTVTGPPGVGKSRLAVEVARNQASGYRDGAWYVDLAAASDLVSVCRALSDALCHSPAAIESVLQHIRGRQLLLLFDGCEHVHDAVAVLAARILRNCPTVDILTTSRSPLRVDGEAVWRVTGLALPGAGTTVAPGESVRLFRDRATLANPDWDEARRSRAIVAQLVRRLDGLPLAIELAADQLTTMTLEELAGRLAAGSVWLATDRHGRTPRNRSLLASVAWSYEQLAGPARRLLCRLSIFPGTFSVADATAICSGPPLDALGLPRLLTDLVTGSLVESAGTRYRLLAPVREFAQERLIGAGEAHVVALRYARHLARVPMQGIRREQRGPLAAVSA